VGQAEVVEGVEAAEARGDDVVREQQQRADDGEQLAPVPRRGVHAAAVGVDAADLRVRPPDREHEHAHGRDEVHARPAGEGEGQAQHVQAAGAPVAEQQPGGLPPAYVSRTFACQ
jgi:hypothetical protein